MKRMLTALAVLTALALMVGATALPAHAAAAKPAYAQAILDAVNAERTAAGLPALAFGDDDLQAAADDRAEALAAMTLIAHSKAEWEAALDANDVFYNSSGENYTKDLSTIAAVKAAWMLVPEFKANVLNKDFTKAAISVDGDTGVMLFIDDTVEEEDDDAPPSFFSRFFFFFDFFGLFRTIRSFIRNFLASFIGIGRVIVY